MILHLHMSCISLLFKKIPLLKNLYNQEIVYFVLHNKLVSKLMTEVTVGFEVCAAWNLLNKLKYIRQWDK